MRRLFGLIFFIASISSFAQTDTKTAEIVASENAFWKSYIDGNITELAKLHTEYAVPASQSGDAGPT
jgi:hypothetical protein